MGGTGRWGEHLASDPLPDELCAHWPALGLWGGGGVHGIFTTHPRVPTAPLPAPPALLSLCFSCPFSRSPMSHTAPLLPLLPSIVRFPSLSATLFLLPSFLWGGGGEGHISPCVPPTQITAKPAKMGKPERNMWGKRSRREKNNNIY